MRLLSTIIWKEAKGLQPFFVFMIVFFIVGLLSTQFLEFMDDKPIWADIIAEQHAFLSALLLIIAFIGCLGILPREKEEGSLLFLEGLPLNRPIVYFAKWSVVFSIVSLYLILLFVEILFYEWLSGTSTSPTIPWRHLLTFYLLNLFLCAFFVAILFPLSFLRLWALLFIILYFIIVYILISLNVPYAALLSPIELVQPPIEIENEWVIPWKRLIIYTMVGIAAYLYGLFWFCRIPAVSMKPDKHFLKTFGGWVNIITTILAVGFGLLVVISIIASNLAGQATPGSTPALVGGANIKKAKTKHFEFLYRDEMTDRIAPLIAEADDVYLEVATLLQAEDHQSLIVVDLTSPLASHNAGQAYWNKIRMTFPPHYTLEEARAVFGHEVTHVVIDRISDRRLSKIFGSARWFHEGLASYVEFTVFRETTGSEDYQRWLALAASWDEVKFVDFMGGSATNSDTYLVYPAGYEAVHAIVDVYGEESLPKLLKAMGRKKVARKMTGMQFWADSFLAAGYDLERVRAQFRKRLNNLEQKHKKMCARLPEIVAGTATKKGNQLVIKPELPKDWKKNAPADAKLVCRIRPSKNSQPHQWRYAKLTSDETFLSEASSFPTPNIGFQVGWIVKSWTKEPVFGEWVEIDLNQK